MTDQNTVDNDPIDLLDAADYAMGTLSIIETGLESISAVCLMIVEKHPADSLAASLAQLAALEVGDMLGYCVRGMAAANEARAHSLPGGSSTART